MQIQPYLFFNGRCEEAVEFYRRVLGAEVEMLMRFNESPEPPERGQLPPGMEKKGMHAARTSGPASAGRSRRIVSLRPPGARTTIRATAPAHERMPK